MMYENIMLIMMPFVQPTGSMSKRLDKTLSCDKREQLSRPVASQGRTRSLTSADNTHTAVLLVL